MFDHLKKISVLKRLQKTMTYSRLRQYLPMREAKYVDDRAKLEDAEIVRIDWPDNINKPRVGIVRDIGDFPHWTKYCRFLEKNSFPYRFFDIHSHDWIERTQGFDVVVGRYSCERNHLEEIQKKYYFLETYMGKKCYPSSRHAFLYEDKSLEAYLSEFFDLPFAKTYISYSKKDALALLEKLTFPLVSKINPSSASIGVELLRTQKQARRIIEQAFSRIGRKTFVPHFRQKNYVYFQEFIPNDGFDIRVIVVANWAFGYYRKVLNGDFRASGMNIVEKREIPHDAIRTAYRANRHIQSPLLAVDMVYGLDGRYTIIEFSPYCQTKLLGSSFVNDIPGAYVIDDKGDIHFNEGRFWVDELAIREYLLHHYLPSVSAKKSLALR